MRKPLYIDHQATTPVESVVLEAMKPFWQESYGNPHSSEHIIGWNANSVVEEAKVEISKLIGCSPDEVFFTSGATESNNLAAFSLCDLSRLHPDRKQILLSPIEHKCVISSSDYWAERYGLSVKFLKVDKNGYIDLDFLSDAVKMPSLFCSIGYVNNEIGTIQEIAEISNILKRNGCLFHSDCAQAPKTADCSMISELVDLSSFSGHKIGAPPGIGVLHINAQLHEKLSPLIQGGGQQNGIRPGTLPLPLCVGMGEAFRLLNTDFAAKSKNKTLNLRKHFFAAFDDSECEVMLNGPPLSERHVGNLNVSFKSINAADLLMSLQPRICASTGSACSSQIVEPSHVLLAIGLSSDRISQALRFSFSHQMSFDEVEQAVEIIAEKITEQSLYF